MKEKGTCARKRGLAQMLEGGAIMDAVTRHNDPVILAEISRSLGEPMVGAGISALPEAEHLAVRGW